MIRVALVEPEIPPNTGNIARLCAAANVPLHIVGVTGFRLDDKAVRRAGLDYWPEVQLERHRNLGDLQEKLPEARFLFLTTKADGNLLRAFDDVIVGKNVTVPIDDRTRTRPFLWLDEAEEIASVGR